MGETKPSYLTDSMSYWQEYLTIGNLHVPRFIGGPLDGITDSPFRTLVREFSTKELLYTEMRHVGCVANDKGKSKTLAFEQSERPLNYQISANNINFIEQACERILAAGVDMIDLNIGCPAPNVIKSGSGSALMADLPRLKLILQTLRKHVPIPFTLKMRSGFKCVNAPEVAKLVQDCGIDAIAIHPRTQPQKFEGRPDYSIAAQVKQAVTIPVLLSGNVINFKTAQLAYQQTGVDGFLIGRGIWSKPWKLHEMSEHAQGRAFSVDTPTIMRYALKHLQVMLAYYGPHGLYAFRKHVPFYLKGLHDASLLRQKIVTCTEITQVQDLLTSLMHQYGPAT